MSEQTSSAPIRERVKRPKPLHDAMIGLVQQIVDERTADKQQTMGTVTAMDGVNPVVWVDGESATRRIGFPAKTGQRYAPGMRVLLGKTRAGNFTVQGSVGGTQAVVGTEQMVAQSVTRSVIAADVTSDISSALYTGQQGVSQAFAASNAAAQAQSTAYQGVSSAQQAQSSAQQAQSQADSAYNLAANASNAANNAQATANSAQQTANAASNNAASASLSAQNAQQTANQAQGNAQDANQKANCVARNCACASGC